MHLKQLDAYVDCGQARNLVNCSTKLEDVAGSTSRMFCAAFIFGLGGFKQPHEVQRNLPLAYYQVGQRQGRQKRRMANHGAALHRDICLQRRRLSGYTELNWMPSLRG
jgi:hypothetical protein